MWKERKRLIALAGVSAVLAGIVVFLYTRSGVNRQVDRLHSDDAGERVEAIHALARSDSDSAADALGEAAGDSDAEVAREAVAALGRMRRAKNASRVRRALDDKRAEVRAAAAVALGDLGDPADVPVLVERLAEPAQGSHVRAAVAFALGRLDDWRAMPALVDALEDPSPKVRGRAYSAIRRILQLDVGFRASDPPAKRRAIIARIRQFYPSMEKRHEDYVRRMREKGKRK